MGGVGEAPAAFSHSSDTNQFLFLCNTRRNMTQIDLSHRHMDA